MSAAGLLLLAACGSSDTDTSGSTGGTGGTSTSTSRFSPLEEFLSPSSSGGSDTPEAYAAQEKRVQELITTCMTDQGFDYIPFVYPIETATSPQSTDWGSRDWAAKYGYGISTMDSGVSTSSSAAVDPNQAIVEAMSPGEQQAYSEALYGGSMASMGADPAGAVSAGAVSSSALSSSALSSSALSSPALSSPALSTEAVSTDAASTDAVPGAEPAPATEPVSIPADTVDPGGMSIPAMADQGCWGQSQAEVYGDMNGGVNSPDTQAQFQTMWDAYNTMYNDIESDPGVKAAATAWTDCMSAAGHTDLTDVWSASQQVNDKWSELNGWGTGMPIDGGGVAVTSVAATASTTSPSAPAADKVAAFKEYEIALALADWDCKDSSKYNTVSDAVRIELEKKFVDEHRSELEQYRDLMNSGG
ncbi:MAG: hypothetical protein ABI074_10010 [Nakamurella sp.]